MHFVNHADDVVQTSLLEDAFVTISVVTRGEIDFGDAIDNELVLVTNDKGIHDYIKPCCVGLLDCEDWEVPPLAASTIVIPFASQGVN